MTTKLVESDSPDCRELTPKEKRKMQLSLLVSDWANYDRFKLLSVTTRRNYVGRLYAFCKANEGITVAMLTFVRMRNYLLKIQTTVPSAVCTNRAALRHFCRWLHEEGWIPAMLPLEFDLPRVQKRRRDAVPEEHVQKIMDAADRLPFNAYRASLYRAALAALVYGGLRRNEAVSLDDEDFDAELGILFIKHGKGDKPRKVHLPKRGVDMINAYRAIRGTATTSKKLFFWRGGREFGRHGIASAVAICCKVAGVPQYTCHQFRHSYGSRLVANGAALPTVQELMGHVNIATTGIYLHSGETQKKAAAELAGMIGGKPSENAAPPAKRQRVDMRVRRKIR